MNLFFCTKCLNTYHSSMNEVVCPDCKGEMLINPEKEVMTHLKEFRKLTITNKQEVST